jgi:uncharacterized membrane protein
MIRHHCLLTLSTVLMGPVAARMAVSAPATSAPAPAFRVQAVQSDKVLYAPGEAGILRLQLRNDDDAPRRGRLVIALRGGLTDRQVVTERDIEIGPRTGQVLEVPFIASGRFGHEAVTSLQAQGQPDTSASDFFAVSSNFFEVGIGYNTVHGTQSGKHREIPPGMRRTYSNWIEFLFWAPCDWSTLISPLPKWWSGQASYPEDEANIQELIGLLHKQGIKASAYASCNPAGPFAWDLARRQPQWFFRDSQGGIAGSYDVEGLTFWNDPVWREANEKNGKKGAPKTSWYSVPVDLRNLEALDWGIDQIAASARHYGWDAVRFDGHYTLRGDDERSAWNMRRLKRRVLGEKPDFRFAFNYGRAPEWRDGVTREMRDALAGGGGYVQEGIRNWRYTDEQYKSWRHYATNELRIGRLIGSMGGSYHCIWQLGTGHTPAQRLYKLVYGLIAGGHPMYGSHASVTDGCGNWGAFMTRWSALLWDPAIQPVADASKWLTVEPPSRLEWQPLVQQCVAAPDRKFFIVHLVNPPTSDEIATAALPKPIEEATTIRYQPEAGTTLQRAMLVRPDMQPYERPLDIGKAADGAVEVQVASVQYWALVVFELSGSFQQPKLASGRDVTIEEPAPPSVNQVAAAPVVVDPNKTENQFESGNSAVWATDRSFSGHGIRRIIADPQASGGKAQAREMAEDGGGTYPFLGRPWMGPFRPGRYRVVAHLKYVPPVDGADSLILQYRVHDGSIDKDIAAVRLFAPGVAGLPAPDTLLIRKPGEFQDYDLDVSLEHTTLLTVSLYPVSKSARSTILLDHIRIDPVETYSDAQLAAQDKPPYPPVGLRTPAGAQPQRLLLIRGMFHQPYGADRLKGVDVAYEPPQSYEELFNYDGLVMCDIGVANWSVSLRYMIKQWIEAGGRLIVLGGPYTLGQGGMQGTFLEEVLPVTLKGSYEVVRCEPPLAVSLERLPDNGRTASGAAPVIFWRHDLPGTKGASVLAWAGKHPLVLAQRFGAGRTLVFTGTTLGEAGPAGNPKPFWETELWRSLLERMVLGRN